MVYKISSHSAISPPYKSEKYNNVRHSVLHASFRVSLFQSFIVFLVLIVVIFASADLL
jgi:hypothetical protein